jgi:hypothetical protein
MKSSKIATRQSDQSAAEHDVTEKMENNQYILRLCLQFLHQVKQRRLHSRSKHKSLHKLWRELENPNRNSKKRQSSNQPMPNFNLERQKYFVELCVRRRP